MNTIKNLSAKIKGFHQSKVDSNKFQVKTEFSVGLDRNTRGRLVNKFFNSLRGGGKKEQREGETSKMKGNFYNKLENVRQVFVFFFSSSEGNGNS